MRYLLATLALLAAAGVLLYCTETRADTVTVRMAATDPTTAVLCVVDCSLVAADSSIVDPGDGGDWMGWYHCAVTDPDDPLAPLSWVMEFAPGDVCVRVVAKDLAGVDGWSLASADQKVCRLEPAP